MHALIRTTGTMPIACLILAGIALAPMSVQAEHDESTYLEAICAGLPITMGDSTEVGHEEETEVLSYHHHFKVVDTREVHEPVRIVKPITPSTIGFLDALIKSKECEFTLRFFRPAAVGGAPEHYLTVELTRGFVIDRTTWRSEFDSQLGNVQFEAITLKYHDIIWKYIPTGGEAIGSNPQ